MVKFTGSDECSRVRGEARVYVCVCVDQNIWIKCGSDVSWCSSAARQTATIDACLFFVNMAARGKLVEFRLEGDFEAVGKFCGRVGIHAFPRMTENPLCTNTIC